MINAAPTLSAATWRDYLTLVADRTLPFTLSI